MRLHQLCLMRFHGNSSIDDITDALERVLRQRGLLRVLHADKDVDEIASCVQRLMQCVDNFLVGRLVIISYLISS
jgi:hypothetical protein